MTFKMSGKSKNRSPLEPQQKHAPFLLEGWWRLFEYYIGDLVRGQCTIQISNTELYPLWDGERGSVGNPFTGYPHRNSLYIKRNWSWTKEPLQIRNTKTPLWGTSEWINERRYTFEHSVLRWPELHRDKQLKSKGIVSFFQFTQPLWNYL